MPRISRCKIFIIWQNICNKKNRRIKQTTCNSIYYKISTICHTIFTWFWWPEQGMWLIYKINSIGKISSPENATLNDERWQMYIGQTKLCKRSVYMMRRAQWGSVGCGCAWNGSIIYNYCPLCHGYSVFIASLKWQKYQTAYKQWSPEQPVSASVMFESTSRK